MKALCPSAKVGIILVGLVVALVVALVAVEVNHLVNPLPPAEASGGMAAFGDLLLGIAVFGVAALVPLALGLYWLRPVERFWSVVTWGAMLYALTGLVALAAELWTGLSTSNWRLLADARIGSMPLSVLALLTCACLAPHARQRWVCLASALLDGAIFVGVVLVKFILPRLAGG